MQWRVPLRRATSSQQKLAMRAAMSEGGQGLVGCASGTAGRVELAPEKGRSKGTSGADLDDGK